MGYGGIALAVVDALVIRDNFILDNCVNCIDPICGIFALAVIGADISRNEITEHLPQDYAAVAPAAVKHGPRGGIWIFIALGQMDLFSSSKYDRFSEVSFLRNSSGAHAARLHQNVVSVPLGRSLTMTIFGDASILGNRFTSYGIVPIDITKLILALLTSKSALRMSAILQLFSLIAANVLIFDLGSFVAFREFRRIQASLGKLNAINPIEGASRLVNMVTAAGMIHFSDNQCKLNPRNRDVTIAFSSILIVGLADEGFHDNQSSCNIPRSLLITNAALFAGTIRATGNWLKETFMHVGFSAFTFGLLNATTDNESVHCLRASGSQFLNRHNLILGALFGGVTGDVAEDEVRKKLLDVCGRNSATLILGQMYLAITRNQNEADTEAMGSFINTGGGR
jgi:hypothetical protein